jgi:hypothetical protein
MRPRLDPARRERERLLAIELRATARAETLAVSEGVAETVALSRARGAAIEGPQQAQRGRREGPYRRQPGLEWLTRKGRIHAAQRAAGERYGAVYRRAKNEGAIPSTLDLKPRTSAPGGASLTSIMGRAEGTAQASARLASFRQRLAGQLDLVRACDLVCGEELTPREASENERDAGRLEAVLMVALDLLATEAICS